MEDSKFLSFKKLTPSMIDKRFREILDVENMSNEPYSEKVLKEIVTDSKVDTFACICEDRVIGFLSLNPQSTKYFDKSIYLINLVIDKDFRHQGVASKLIYESYRYYRDTHSDMLYSLDVDTTNIPAFNLYKKIGFQVMDVDSKNVGDNEVVMAVKLETLGSNLDCLAYD